MMRLNCQRRSSRALKSDYFVACVTVVLMSSFIAADQTKLESPVVVAVKTIGSAESSAQPMNEDMMPRATEFVATLPGQRTPQYKTGILQTELEAVDDEGNIRLLVASKELLETFQRPLLIQVKPLIDGKTLPEHRSVLAASLKQRKAESSSGDGDAVTSYRLTTDTGEVASRFAAATGLEIDDQDSEWLLNHWTAGPMVLCLRDYFQSFRAEARPAFQVFDRNHDGTLSAEEISNAADSLQRCDADRNDVVTVLEIDNAAQAISRLDDRAKAAAPFLFLVNELPSVTARDEIRYPLVSSIDANDDRQIDASEMESVLRQPADVVVTIEFNTSETAGSKTTLNAVATDFAESCGPSDVTGGIEIRHGGHTLIVSAVQSKSIAESQQVSVGLMQDGYPLLPWLDPNDDGRFTIRELRTLPERLQTLDADQDGKIAVDEVQSPLRIAIGLGPTVHRELALVRSIRQDTSVEPEAAPDWFVRMDRNRDGDLSRSEFPGEDSQFEAMDQDGDGLIDVGEANRF